MSFPSGDGTTPLVAYVFKPATDGPYPAVIMLHGRGGPYSSLRKAGCTQVGPGHTSDCNAATLSKRHVMWGRYWADHGYLAVLPDSFGPRGKAGGFGRFTHGRPERDDVNEKTVRPSDVDGTLAYLRTRGDVAGDRIFLQGWSNGGSTALNVLIGQASRPGVRGALVFYPGCGKAALLQPMIATPAPIRMFLAEADEEVSPAQCVTVANRSREAGTTIDVLLYPGATHGFDEPSSGRQSLTANQAALEDAQARALSALDLWKTSR